MLYYLTKHLRSNIANVTHSLSKVTDDANSAVFHELLCVIKFVLDKKIDLKVEPLGNASKPLEIVCFCNSNHAGDPISRRSVSGFISMF